MIRGLITAAALVSAPAAQPVDLDRATALVREGRYQEACDLLLQERHAQAGAVEAHLALGRALFAQGRFGEARLQFETVLQFHELPLDLRTQVEIYDQAAEQYLNDGVRLTHSGHVETGFGGYRTNSTRGSTGGDRDSTFFNVRTAGGIDYLLPKGYALDATLDYRFRHHDEDGVRNDSDLRWRFGGSRTLGDGNLAGGFRGRVSYRGNGQYRNDYSIFMDYRHMLDGANQLSLGGEVRRRRYPEGPLRARSRTTADVSLDWAHVLSDQATFSMSSHGGRNYATSRPDGDSTFYGLTIDLDYAFSDTLGWYAFGRWEHDNFNTDAYHAHPDEDAAVILRREDNLYEFGTSLVWTFRPDWTIRPEVRYIRDESNATNFNYSSTEYWINVRRGF